MFTHSYCCCHYLFPLLNNGPQMPAPLMQASLFRLKWPVPPLQVPAQVDSSQWCHLNWTWFCWLYLLFPPSSHLVVDDPYALCISSASCNSIYMSCFLCRMSATFRHVYSIKSTSPVCCYPLSSWFWWFLPTWFFSITVPIGMNGKSILSAMVRHTPEHSSVMNTTGLGATTSPSSSRTSSLRSGTGQHTPGGCHQLPCTQVKASEVSSNALNPNTGPARSPVSPKLSPGDLAASSYHLPSVVLIHHLQ